MPYASLISSESPAVTTTARRPLLRTRLLGAGVALAAALLSACGGGSGADVQENPGLASTGPAANYNGPAPSTPDVQQFKINLWDNIQANNRCGSCHSDSGGQAPMFARRDDINLAYTAANGVVTLMTPQDSTMVVKVGGGHNCWLASNAACGDILTTWITNWSGSTGSTAARKIELEPPVLRDPGQSKNFPADQGALFLTTVYPLLEATLLRVPFVGLSGEATAVLRGRPAERLGRRRGRVRSRQVEDESRRPGHLALRRASGRRVPQLLDGELRQ